MVEWTGEEAQNIGSFHPGLELLANREEGTFIEPAGQKWLEEGKASRLSPAAGPEEPPFSHAAMT